MPGSGRTAILRQLELNGFSVIEEAATDVIAAAQARGTAESWRDASAVRMRFQKIHEGIYRKFAFELIYLESASLLERVNKID